MPCEDLEVRVARRLRDNRKTVGKRGYIGQSVRTVGGDAVLRGRLSFTGDVMLPGQLHAHIVRSPHAAARIVSVDLSGATKVAGVVLALDGQGAAKHCDPIPHYLDPAVFGGRTTEIRCLAVERVRHFGQPVAVVVATDKRTARYAASKVRVTWEPTPAVTDAAAALEDDAPRVVPEWDRNSIMEVPFSGGDAERRFKEADRVSRSSVRIHRFSTQPIETRAYNAAWNAGDGTLTLHATAQNPHPLRNVLSKALRLPENRIRIVATNIGGAFGLKMHGHPEEALVCLLSMLTGRPVRWVEDREECLLVGGREQHHAIELALRKDGRIIGIRDRFLANTGAPSACPGWGMAFLTGLTMPGPYDVADVSVTMNAVVTNKPPWNASRGYGKEATAIVLELAVERAARELGIDPLEMRCRNFVPSGSFPRKTATGLVLDSGDYEGALRKAADLIGYAEWRTRQSEARATGRHYGIGLAYEVTPEGGALPGTMVAGFDTTTVRAGPDGSVTVLTGVTNPGTGNPTAIAQIVADELGVALDSIRVLQGDTDACPYGFGNYSGRSTIVGGGSAALAARDVRAKVVTVAAALLGVPADSIVLREGVVTSGSAPNRTLTFADLCYASYTQAYGSASGIELPLEATRSFKPGLISHQPDENGKINPYPSYSNAAYAVVCEVDVETGRVKLLRFAAAHDCGRVIHPTLVEGQACGAIAFGIGGVLGEEIISDAKGQQLTTSFVDYTMPRALDIPEVAMAHCDSPNPVTYLGLKGAGEAGVGGSAAAVINAVNDALSAFGVEIQDLPLSPSRIWNRLQAARVARERPAAVAGGKA
jgi:carbon-monoxide dehydrogenase large subunit